MVKIEFSEFGYGFAATKELIDLHGQGVCAPRFPTQNEEASAGYDVRIDDVVVPLFLQFKRPEHLTQANAREWSVFLREYYRVELRTGNHRSGINQHNLLVDLEARFPGEVFYLAPRWYSGTQFDDRYATQSILATSLALHPTEVGHLPDREQHSIVYTADREDGAYLCSEPVELQQSEASVELLAGALVGAEQGLQAVSVESLVARCRDLLGEYDLPLPSRQSSDEWDQRPASDLDIVADALLHHADVALLLKLTS